jgi:hypothetical protein
VSSGGEPGAPMGSRMLPAAAGFLVAALLLAAGVALLLDGDPTDPERSASIPAIVRSPQRWEGRAVLVSGRIVSVYARAFTVGTPEAELLVVLGDGHDAQPFGIDDIGAPLRLRGVIERFGGQLDIAPGRGDGSRANGPLLRAQALQRRVGRN